MTEKVKQWIRPLTLVWFLALISLACFDYIDELPTPLWVVINIVFVFFFGERGAQNILRRDQ